MHLLAAITAHGYGHLAQTAAVVNALRRRLPELRLTLYTRVPRKIISTRIEGDFILIDESPDIGMPMQDALTVDIAAATAAYRDFHAHWEQDVVAEAQRLRALAPEIILANVPYRILAAAQLAGIPAMAFCSLNWADIYHHYCGDRPEAESVVRQIVDAYRAADAFLRPVPSMPMPDLANTKAVGPIARVGTSRRAELAAECGAAPDARFVLVSLGGIPMEFDVEHWPQQPGLHWIIPSEWKAHRQDMIALGSLRANFVDVLASVDILLTKPGYGSFAEAACNGIPVLYVPRLDWPEEPHLVEWLARNGRCLRITQQQLERGAFLDSLETLLRLSAPPPVPATGDEEAAEHLLAAHGR